MTVTEFKSALSAEAPDISTKELLLTKITTISCGKRSVRKLLRFSPLIAACLALCLITAFAIGGGSQQTGDPAHESGKAVTMHTVSGATGYPAEGTRWCECTIAVGTRTYINVVYGSCGLRVGEPTGEYVASSTDPSLVGEALRAAPDFGEGFMCVGSALFRYLRPASGGQTLGEYFAAYGITLPEGLYTKQEQTAGASAALSAFLNAASGLSEDYEGFAEAIKADKPYEGLVSLTLYDALGRDFPLHYYPKIGYFRTFKATNEAVAALYALQTAD